MPERTRDRFPALCYCDWQAVSVAYDLSSRFLPRKRLGSEALWLNRVVWRSFRGLLASVFRSEGHLGRQASPWLRARGIAAGRRSIAEGDGEGAQMNRTGWKQAGSGPLFGESLVSNSIQT